MMLSLRHTIRLILQLACQSIIPRCSSRHRAASAAANFRRGGRLMRLKTLVLCTTALGAFAAAPALAQDATPAAPASAANAGPQDNNAEEGPDIVVTGLRASLASAQSLKRRAPQI